MDMLPDKLPRPFILTFYQTNRKFRQGKPLWPIFERTLENAGKAGHDIIAVKALIIGTETASIWLDHPRRKEVHSEAAKERKRRYRFRKHGFVGEIGYTDAQRKAHALTLKAAEQYLSLIVYGFMLDRSVRLFEDLDWKPFLDALGLVLIEDHHEDFAYTTEFETGLTDREIRGIKADDDAYNQNARHRVFEALRTRIYRLRKKEEEFGDRVEFLATHYFQELYATVTKRQKIRTIRDRQKRV